MSAEPFDAGAIDQIADLVAERLAGRSGFGTDGGVPPVPPGELDLERPPQLPPHLEGPIDVLIPRARLLIAGIEVTQSIQYDDVAGPSHGPRNGVPLVALKTLVVRVYPTVTRGFATGSVPQGAQIGGELIVSIGNREIYRTRPTRSGVRVGSQDKLDRGLWDEELTAYVPERGACGCGCSPAGLDVPLDRLPYIDFHEVIEWRDDVAGIAFHRDGETLAAFQAGEAPQLAIEGPELHEGEDGQELVVRVRAAHQQGEPSVAVLFSGDDGQTWEPVAIDAREEVRVLARRLPGGERCRFRAIATAELRSAVADTEPFELPAAPRRIHVLAPEDGAVVRSPVALSAAVESWDEPLEPGDVRWESDRDEELGRGLHLVAHLRPGRHIIVATAPDGSGGRTSASVRMTVD